MGSPRSLCSGGCTRRCAVGDAGRGQFPATDRGHAIGLLIFAGFQNRGGVAGPMEELLSCYACDESSRHPTNMGELHASTGRVYSRYGSRRCFWYRGPCYHSVVFDGVGPIAPRVLTSRRGYGKRRPSIAAANSVSPAFRRLITTPQLLRLRRKMSRPTRCGTMAVSGIPLSEIEERFRSS